MQDLKNKKCQTCEGLEGLISEAAARDFMASIPQWTLSEDARSIHRRFEFKGFTKVMMFLNAMAWIVQNEGHHPDVSFSYNSCDITFTTHALQGLSENDFICAAKIDAL